MQSRGKKSNLKIGVTYITIGVFLLACLIGGLYAWYVFLPAFAGLIICLGIVFSVIIIYFLLLRGVFLGKNSGYEINDDFLIYKDGYPNSKKYVIKIKEISLGKIKPYRFAFLITAIITFVAIFSVAILLKVSLNLKLLIVVIIMLGALLISGYFLALHFLSLSLAKCKVYVSGKKIVFKNIKTEVLQNLSEIVQQKGGLDEV